MGVSTISGDRARRLPCGAAVRAAMVALPADAALRPGAGWRVVAVLKVRSNGI